MTTLCHIDDIPEGGSKGFEIGETLLFAVKKWGEIHLYVNSCPHLGIRLDWMPDSFLDHGGELIVCSTHGAEFVIDSGECVAGPCLGQALQPVPFEIIEERLVAQLPNTDAAPDTPA